MKHLETLLQKEIDQTTASLLIVRFCPSIYLFSHESFGFLTRLENGLKYEIHGNTQCTSRWVVNLYVTPS
jgi:hypothetical protein